MSPMHFFGKELTTTDQVKHLGIVLDSKLTWKEHLQSKCKLECGPMPNVMVALPTTGGAVCSTPQFG